MRWLTRCTFGFTTQELADFNALGANDDARWPAWVNQQLDRPRRSADSACDARIASAGFTTLNKSANQFWNDHHSVTNNYFLRMLPVSETECATVIRQTYSRRQLQEVMVDFWHDHFSVFGWDYDGGPMFPAFDRLAIRPHVFGNFRSMLQAVGESASMMYMLDLYSSEASHPNENYARELFELHTLGAEHYGGIVQNPDSFANMNLLGHYTAPDGEEERLKYVDDDVYEAARALTGWTISGANWPYTPINGVPLGQFAYDSSTHDQGVKRILARYFAASQGQLDGTALFDMLARHPGTARHVATKICRRFVGATRPRRWSTAPPACSSRHGRPATRSRRSCRSSCNRPSSRRLGHGDEAPRPERGQRACARPPPISRRSPTTRRPTRRPRNSWAACRPPGIACSTGRHRMATRTIRSPGRAPARSA